MNDKIEELKRYDDRAIRELENAGSLISVKAFGEDLLPDYLRSPYSFYNQYICKLLKPGNIALELGAGTGAHTDILVQTGAKVIATDISPNSLELLSRRYSDKVETRVADMEELPFGDNTFDMITSAGSLSYGDPGKVNGEIYRVLKPGGAIIVVDSLNHSIVYRLNRWIGYKRGSRTLSTIARMPTCERIEQLAKMFSTSEVRYYGSISYLMPIVSRIVGSGMARQFSDTVDKLLRVKKSAFKFVLVAQGLNK